MRGCAALQRARHGESTVRRRRNTGVGCSGLDVSYRLQHLMQKVKGNAWLLTKAWISSREAVRGADVEVRR